MRIDEIKDPEVKKLVEKVRSYELESRITECWQDDENFTKGKTTEMEMHKREVNWLVEDIFVGYGHLLHDEYLEAKRWLNQTNNGKRFTVIDIDNFQNELKANQIRTREAKNFINEANRLKRLDKKLNG